VKISNNIEVLIDALKILPGVGPKTAKRMALNLLSKNKEGAEQIASSIQNAIETIRACDSCGVINDLEECNICSSASRDNSSLCLVETTSDLFSIEETKEFGGKYFVLNGLLSPIENIGPEELKIPKLIEICKKRTVKEVIIALNSTLEGEATSYYLLDKLEGLDIKISKLAQGVPAGGDLNYVDSNTLRQAFSWRRELEKN
jgi:recombination protein RecR|tara:strand:+ start:4785 stop:5390 length:606 start_codon:yes stop_codon:yes gene_type:complete